MKHHTKFSHLFTGLLPILVCLVAVGGLLLGAQPVFADTQGPLRCIQPNSGLNKVNCTANDVRIAGVALDPDNPGEFLISPKTCDPFVNGGLFDLTATFRIVTTASERYDVGVYFDIRGDPQTPPDGARTGFCSVNKLPIPPAFDLDGDNTPGNTCGDTVQGVLLVELTIQDVACVGDQFVKLPNCTSWAQNDNTLCTTDAQAKPGTTSKCSCDDAFTIPVLIQRGELGVTKVASPLTLPEPGGEFTYTVTVTNTGAGTVTLTNITDDVDMDNDIDATYPAIDFCDKTTLLGGQTPPDSTTCTFTRNFFGEPGATSPDRACANGNDPAGPVSACANAVVSITDVAPNAAVSKTVGSLVCATVTYHVGVTNLSQEPLTLSALCDNQYGDITAAGDSNPSCAAGSEGSIIPGSSDCAVGGSIPVGNVPGNPYTCSFAAEFCGQSSISDTVTGTLDDNDVQSEPITRTGSATVTVTVTSTSP
jgi:hypothetical protein